MLCLRRPDLLYNFNIVFTLFIIPFQHYNLLVKKRISFHFIKLPSPLVVRRGIHSESQKSRDSRREHYVPRMFVFGQTLLSCLKTGYKFIISAHERNHGCNLSLRQYCSNLTKFGIIFTSTRLYVPIMFQLNLMVLMIACIRKYDELQTAATCCHCRQYCSNST